jgi:aspartyl-tRNA(Asn)/glutamyl-tRNA(Gln) amidotransferase subunit B
MEKGQMRCDANISVREVGDKVLGAKVEVKNINSFKMVAAAIEYESGRQIEMLERGEKISQETRGWDAAKGKTTAQRSKEYANDYRYFPEPDIPPIEVGRGKTFDPEVINDRLPELPKEKQVRFISEYGLSSDDARIISANFDLSDYFEKTLEKIPAITEGSEAKRKIGKQVANLIINEIIGKVADVYEITLKPSELAGLVTSLEMGEITLKILKDVLGKALVTGKNPAEIIKSEGIAKSDDSAVLEIVEKVIAANRAEVERYRTGESRLFGFFVGEVMKESKGQADPQSINKLLHESLEIQE